MATLPKGLETKPILHRLRGVAPRAGTQGGWFENATGQTFFALRYAGTVIELAKDKNAIEVSEFEKLPATIDTLIEAVQAGELDAQLTAAAEARGQMLRKKTAA
jgi:hypothetical protein